MLAALLLNLPEPQRPITGRRREKRRRVVADLGAVRVDLSAKVSITKGLSDEDLVALAMLMLTTT